jgi:putative transposase
VSKADIYPNTGGLFFGIIDNVWYTIYMDKTAYFTIPKDVTHGRGYIYSLQYHIVWVTKYRKSIFTGEIESDVKEYLTETLNSLDMSILAMEVMPNHIHLLVDCKPQLRLSDAIKILKGNTARWLFLKHPELKKQLWGGHLWNPSYFVATVSDRTLDQVKHYLDSQKTTGH